MKRKRQSPQDFFSCPLLRQIVHDAEKWDPSRFPFNLRPFSQGIDIDFRSRVTFFVGENGSGKSTLLEAIAECCGFNPEGGNRDHYYGSFADRSQMAQALRLTWQPKTFDGFFMRAESFQKFLPRIHPGGARMAGAGRGRERGW